MSPLVTSELPASTYCSMLIVCCRADIVCHTYASLCPIKILLVSLVVIRRCARMTISYLTLTACVTVHCSVCHDYVATFAIKFWLPMSCCMHNPLHIRWCSYINSLHDYPDVLKLLTSRFSVSLMNNYPMCAHQINARLCQIADVLPLLTLLLLLCYFLMITCAHLPIKLTNAFLCDVLACCMFH